MSQNGFIFPKFRDKNNKYLKFHHLVLGFQPLVFRGCRIFTEINFTFHRSRHLGLPGCDAVQLPVDGYINEVHLDGVGHPGGTPVVVGDDIGKHVFFFLGRIIL